MYLFIDRNNNTLKKVNMVEMKMQEESVPLKIWLIKSYYETSNQYI